MENLENQWKTARSAHPACGRKNRVHNPLVLSTSDVPMSSPHKFAGMPQTLRVLPNFHTPYDDDEQ